MRTCIHPSGRFLFGIHKPSYLVRNLRKETRLETLGARPEGHPVLNQVNHPESDVDVETAEWIYEIANPLPFRGTTFISKKWADRKAADLTSIRLEGKPPMSMSEMLAQHDLPESMLDKLPRPLLLATATSSTDGRDLVRLARLSCAVNGPDPEGRIELRYTGSDDKYPTPEIFDHDLFEAVANNPALPDNYRIAMVVRPGAQGISEIVGDFRSADSHVYEYLRRNSYIGGGHYAANMADDALRYDIDSLQHRDMHGLRRLYYQRTYVRLADELGIEFNPEALDNEGLESLRLEIIGHPGFKELSLSATLWGWNFGFDFSPTGYRLHASHQQIHQQFAMIPAAMEISPETRTGERKSGVPFSAGDMVAESIQQYQQVYGRQLFEDYLAALENNERMDGRQELENSLVVWQDEHVMLFVPKAQVSQWELQVMTRPDRDGWPGNILETSPEVRESLDQALLTAQKVLAGLGARLVTTIEYSKRFQETDIQQPLIYALMPKIPYSPGALSETQMRFINGHYPEDFAAACRIGLSTV